VCAAAEGGEALQRSSSCLATGTAVRCRRKQNEDYARPIHVMCSTTRGTSHIKAFSEIIEFIIVRVCAVEYRTPKRLEKKKPKKKHNARMSILVQRVSQLLPWRRRRIVVRTGL